MSADFVIYFTFELGLQPVPLQTITNENPAGPSLGTIPQARFLLVMLNMLTLQHGANTLSLLLNSGMLALTQTTLRLIGTVLLSYLEESICFANLLCFLPVGVPKLQNHFAA